MKRRRFFQAAVGDGLGFLEEIAGRPQLRLKDLWECPEERLLAVRPLFVTGATVFADGDRMFGRRGRSEPVDLYGLDEPGTFVLCRFDGRSPLAGIADELSTARGWDRARAEACVKDVFLRLVAIGLCTPAHPMGGGGDAAIRDTGVSRGGHDE